MDTRTERNIPGLFFWQKLIPAFALGIIAVKWLVPAITAFIIYLFILIRFRLEKGALPLIVFIFVLGCWYADLSLPELPSSMPQWMSEREKVLISGEVRSVRPMPGNRLKILLQGVVCNSTHSRTGLDGYLSWTWDRPEKHPVPGQRVQFRSRVKPSTGFRNTGLWDYTFYNRTKNIFYRTYTRGPLKEGKLSGHDPDFLQRMRASLRKHILQNAPPGQGGAIFPALLIGDRFFLSQDTNELIRRAGVSHVLALSGLHVGFVASIGFLLSWLAGFVKPNLYLHISRMKLGVLLAAPLVLFYLWLGQFTPSLLRAGCMFGFWGLLLVLGRSRVLMDGLFLAVGLILAFSPLSVFDLGFQLSVLAVSGIGWIYPLFGRFNPAGEGVGRMILLFFLSVLFLSISANLSLLPVLSWNFGTFSPNLLFNIIFVPLLGMFIVPVCGIGGLLLSYLTPWVSGMLFDVGGWCFARLLDLVRWSMEYGYLPEYAVYRPFWQDTLVYYLILGAVVLWRLGLKDKVRILVFPVLLLLCLRFYPLLGEKVVRMDLLDTGQSQCLVISGPQGTRTVVDGGGSFGNFDMGRSIVGPWLCHGDFPVVDNIFMTHGDLDHAGGLAFLLEKFQVGAFYGNGDHPGGRLGKRMEAAFSEKRIFRRDLVRGDVVELEPGLVMEVINPEAGFEGSKNDCSLFLRLLWRGTPLVDISGDLDRKGIRSVLGSKHDLKADVLVLPHHGSAGGFSLELYRRVNPSLALAACGLLNRYGFVAFKVRNGLEELGVPLYTTETNGMISIIWKAGQEMILVP